MIFVETLCFDLDGREIEPELLAQQVMGFSDHRLHLVRRVRQDVGGEDVLVGGERPGVDV